MPSIHGCNTLSIVRAFSGLSSLDHYFLQAEGMLQTWSHVCQLSSQDEACDMRKMALVFQPLAELVEQTDIEHHIPKAHLENHGQVQSQPGYL